MRSRLLSCVSILAIVWPATAPLAQEAAPRGAAAKQTRTSAAAEQLKVGPGALARVKAWPPADEGPDNNFLETYERYYLYPRAYPKLVESPSRRTRAFAQARKVQAYRFDPKAGSQSPPDLAAGHRRRVYGSYPPGSPNGPGGPQGGGTGAPGTTDMAGCAWVSRGPTNINGRITSISIDPNNNQHIFAAGVGGLWRSLDKARTWERVSDDFLATVFASIAVNPNDGTEVVAGGGDPNYQSVPSGSGLGIWRSTSSGQTGSWTKISPPELDDHLIYRIRYDTAAPYNVYAATTNGLYVGTRDGSNNLTFARLGGFDAGVEDFVVDTSVTPHKVYAAVRDASATYAKGVWKYDGTSWTKRDSGIPTANLGTIALALAQSAPSTLYAKISRPRDGSATAGVLLDVYKTSTGGETPGGGGNAWTGLGATALDDSHFIDGTGYSWYNSLIEVDPGNANVVWAAGLSLWRSTSGGSAGSWVNVGGGVGAPGGEWAHSDSHALAFDPANPKIIYDGNDGGITRSADSSAATWGMSHVSHNQTSAQFYKATQQWTPVSFLAGGSQDNGTEITYGGRTWLQPGGCDGADVAIDAVNASTLYANCNGGLYELVNPVPGTPGGGSQATWTMPAGLNPNPPIASDFRTAGAALMAANRPVAPTPANPRPWKPISLVKTTDGLNWSSITADLPTNTFFTFEAIAPSSSFQTYYVGVVGGGTTPNIWRSTTGGTSWQTTATGIPNQYPTRVAVDYTNASRAFATFSSGVGGQVSMTTDGGATWNAIMGSGSSALPPAADYSAVAVDPNNTSVIYVASDVGMFRGVVTMPGSGTPRAAWTSFNEGLPDGLNVTDVTADPATGFLSIGTFGWGNYERDVNAGDMCPAHFAYVRDNVEDRGYLPSPSGVGDPEWPIADPARPGFYKPDDSSAGSLYWWNSADVKVDVPSNDPALNQLTAVDHVEFESCAVRLAACPAGQLLDSQPVRGRPAKVYVQVQNRGTDVAHNVRVIALYADATTVLPLLPTDFWTVTFPAAAPCGAVSPGDWHSLDPSNVCRTISTIRPDRPEVVEFDWNVAAGQAEHSCMLVIIESTEQPLDPSIRSSNERELWVLVPGNSQIANRNLHVVDSSAPGGTAGGSEGMSVPNPTRSERPIQLEIAKEGLFKDGRLIVVLPPEAKAAAQAMMRANLAAVAPVRFRRVELPATEHTKRMVAENHLDPTLAFEVLGSQASFALPVPPGAKWKIGLVYDSGHGPPNTAARFTMLARQGATVLGGSTYMLRISPHPHR